MGEVLDIKSRCFEEGRDMLLRPPRIIQGRALGGRVSDFIFCFYIIMFSSPRRQPVDLPVLQAFLPSKTHKRQSMKTALTTGFHLFRTPDGACWRATFDSPQSESNQRTKTFIWVCERTVCKHKVICCCLEQKQKTAPAAQEPH